MVQKNSGSLLWVIVIILVVLGIVYFSSQAPRPEEAEETAGTEQINFGVITPLTGDAASYGTAMQRAYDLAVEKINAEGGINGKEIKLIYEDGKCEGSAATTAAQKLINVDEVEVIFGGTCSGETLAAAELTQEAGVLIISPSATSPDITDAGDLVFRTYPSDTYEAQLMAKYISEDLELEDVAMISENTDFAQGVRKAFETYFEEADGNIVFDEAYNTGETDFRTLITKMKSEKPEVVYVIPQSPASGELILKQLQESKVKAVVLAANTMLDRSAFEENPDLYDEVVLTEVALNEENEKTSAMLAAYQEKYDSEPEFAAFTAAAYDSVHLIAEALASGEDVDAEGIAEYFNNNVSDWPGAIGILNFDENGDAEIELSLVEVKDGELVPVE